MTRSEGIANSEIAHKGFDMRLLWIRVVKVGMLQVEDNTNRSRLIEQEIARPIGQQR